MSFETFEHYDEDRLHRETLDRDNFLLVNELSHDEFYQRQREIFDREFTLDTTHDSEGLREAVEDLDVCT